jgi:NAD-dependent DNA ligase
VIGSSNLAAGGLTWNYEANVWTTDRAVTSELEDYFDEMFEGGYTRRITPAWLKEYRRLWKERQRQLLADRRMRDQVRAIQGRDQIRKQPRRIKGHSFVFTGKIDGWPREARLYPQVRGFGGNVGVGPTSVSSADCLVHGEVLGGRKSTRKLQEARRQGVAIITEEDFMRILQSEKQSRRRR